MSKFMKKYNVRITAKLHGFPVELSLPVDVSLMAAATSSAIEKASGMNLEEVELLSITERPLEYEQLELDFGEEDCCHEEDCSEEQQFDDSTSGYTPYAPPGQSTSSGYTSYASRMKQSDKGDLPPTYTPKVNNSYTPYKTRVVPIDSKYTKHDFK